MSLADHLSSTLSSLGPFEPSPHLAVAVSGGADSMALCLLAEDWAHQCGGRITALTVDHGLRAESTQEAMQVATWLRERNIPHQILRVTVPTENNVQQHARNARYHALAAWCRKHHVLHVLVAHHADDQAETVVMRRARGITVDGESGMAHVRNHNGIRLLRPLLGVPKKALEDYLRSTHQSWVNDPNNTNPRFTRTQMREQLQEAPETIAHWLHHATQEGVNRHARDVQLAQDAARCVNIYPEAIAHLHLHSWRTLPNDRASNLLSSVLRTIAATALRPRQGDLRRLIDWLNKAKSPSKRPLHRCIVHLRDDHAVICQEHATHALVTTIRPPHIIPMTSWSAHHANPPKALAEAPFWCLNPAHYSSPL